MPAKKMVTIDRDVLSLLTEAASVRADQWAAVARGDEPSTTIDELYEADSEEADNMARLIRGSVDHAEKVLHGELTA